MDEDLNIVRCCFCSCLRIDGIKAARLILFHDMLIFILLNGSILTTLIGGFPPKINAILA